MATKSDPRDAIALLKAEHREVLDAFEEFEKTESDSRKQKLATQICTDLTIHAMLEEEIFYPAFRGKIDDDLLDEAYVEHDSAKVLISQITAGAPGDDFWDAKVKVLGEEIEHHIEEEEKPAEGIFYEARQTEVDLVEMGDQMRARKAELQAKFAAEGLPPPEVRSFSGQPELEIGEEIEEPIAPSGTASSATLR
jgi:hemerythrin HHE cation binding domain-containing protein